MTWQWSEVAAAWGATLGTLNSLILLFSDRPRFLPAPGERSAMDIHIVNPSKRPLQIVSVRPIWKQGNISVYPDSDDETSLRVMLEAIARAGRLNLFVAPNSRSVSAWIFATALLMLFFDGRYPRYPWPVLAEYIRPNV
jgi:hypothetical protein